MPPTALDRIEKLLAMVRRCDRLIALEPHPSSRSPELIRAVAELRIELSADARFTALERSLAVPTTDGVRLALAGVRTAVADEQRRLLAKKVA